LRSDEKCCATACSGLVEEAQLQALGLAPTCRAEELSVADYIRLANSLK
jgi:16S rRNA A1518/A1519 N6-dimethyltransferase RsmA/KsgA/DIM1 with predicted DNA glycosylase/AP lyase activity